MARHTRRLIVWITGVLLSLAVLAMLGIAVLIWGIDPDLFRGRIERAASEALGRRVELTGELRWRPGLNLQIESQGGRIANAEGFGAAPLASWEALRLGVALRPLRHKQLVIDRIEVQGLQLDLMRSAAGVNWNLAAAEAGQKEAGFALTVGSIALRDGQVRYTDQVGGSTWSARELSLAVDLPAQLTAAVLGFSNFSLKAHLSGTPLQPQGVALQVQAPHIELDSARQQAKVPQWQLKWDDSQFSGSTQVDISGAFVAQGKLQGAVPSLRRLLQSVLVSAPATRDAAAFGAFSVVTDLQVGEGAVALTALDVQLDSTRVQGQVRLAALAPLAVRFELAADQVELDRYLTPQDQPSTPLTLPLKALKSLDARGVLTIRRATLAGAAAREMRIDAD